MKYDIDSINNLVDQIGNLHSNALTSFNEQQSKQTARELERIKTETQQKNARIKNQIQGMTRKQQHVDAHVSSFGRTRKFKWQVTKQSRYSDAPFTGIHLFNMYVDGGYFLPSTANLLIPRIS